MPTYNQITVTPGTGQDDYVLTVYAAENTGRYNRTATFSAHSGNLLSTNSLTVTQLKADEFIQMSSPSTTAAGGEVICTGYSNLETITLSGTLLSMLSVLSESKVNGETVTASDLADGFSPTGDPGATGKYAITLVFTVGPNQGGARSFNGTIGDGTTSTSFSISQEAGTGVQSIVFASTRATDAGEGGNISVTLNQAGNAYVDGKSRTLSIDVSLSSMNWTISAISDGGSSE